MPATVTAQFGNPDPSNNPTTFQELIDDLNDLSLAESVEGGPFTPYVISSTTPGVSDQDKLWMKVDGNGRPLETRLYYNGTWRRIYNGNTNEYRMYGGDPSVDFDGTGLGTVGGQWDGWAICNGNNSTPNLSNQFIVFGAMDNAGITGYSGGHWNTSVAGGSTQTGGSALYAIKNTDLPPMKVSINGYKYSAGAGNSPKRVLVDGDYNPANNNFDPAIQASFGSDPNGTPPVPQTNVPTLPPYFCLAIAKFVGYA